VGEHAHKLRFVYAHAQSSLLLPQASDTEELALCGTTTVNGRSILCFFIPNADIASLFSSFRLTGAVLDDSNLDIVVDVRGYHNLPSTFHDSRICLGLASHGERILESCFEQVNADATNREEPRIHREENSFTLSDIDFNAIRILGRRCNIFASYVQ